MKYFNQIHHIAIICSDYQKSKDFYTKVLGLAIIHETYRKDRKSYKLDLQISDNMQIELFSFPDSIKRPSRPEACGLRHLAFRVNEIDLVVNYLKQQNITVEEVRIDEITGKKFTFFMDPDGLPLELYEDICQ